MDSVSQFLMGSAVAQSMLGSKRQGKAFLLGGLMGTLPDLDVLLTIGSSVVDKLVQHRGFSHSFLFTFFAPFFFAYIFKRLCAWNISFKRWYYCFFLVFLTHIILDLMTTWGTQVLWPFSHRYSLDALFIIDPLLTLPLFIGCILALIYKQVKPVFWSLGVSSLYLIFAFSAHAFMQDKFLTSLEKQGIYPQSIIVRPTPFNTLFWGFTAQVDHDHLVMGYARLWDNELSINVSEPIPQNKDYLKAIVNREDVQALLAVTKGFYVIQQTKQLSTKQVIIRDARFGRWGGWQDLSSDLYIFNYVFDLDTQVWSQSRPDDIDYAFIFRSMFARIFNKS
eukprot:COSAG01_NODE_52_length_31456_cov_125.226648_31_plen_336_part_00